MKCKPSRFLYDLEKSNKSDLGNIKFDKKLPSFIFRKIKRGKIRFNHLDWKTTGDVSHIEGKRLVFGTYAPDYQLLYLWGTIEFYRHPNPDDEKGESLWKEICEIMGERVNGDALNVPSGNYLMENVGEEWIAYKDRGIEWWKPINYKKEAK